MSENLASRYTMLARRREPFLTRARDCAALTIPSLMPPDGHNVHNTLPQPYSSLGARGVVNLSSRLLLALYPPGYPFFRLGLTPEEQMASPESQSPEIDTALAMMERVINQETERKKWRKPTSLSLQYLIVTGNVMERLKPDNKIQLYRLDQYVVVRDSEGELKECILKESVDPFALPDEARPLADQDDASKNVDLYTACKRKTTGEYEVWQEVNGQEVPNSRSDYQVAPFNALRWQAVLGEPYGRGHVEEHFADLAAVDGLTKAVLDGAALASRNIIMLRPNAAGGLNLRRRLKAADNGDILIGNPEDMAMMKFDNFAGMQFTQAELQEKKRELAAVFLLNSSFQREGERVTAYELQKMAEELEGALGGVYTMLSADMQEFRLTRLMYQMQTNQQLPPLPEGVIEPTISTGLEALGREQDTVRAMRAMEFAGGLPEDALLYVKWDVILSKGFNGIQMSEAIRTEGEAEKLRADRQNEAQLRQAAQEAASAQIQQGQGQV